MEFDGAEIAFEDTAHQLLIPRRQNDEVPLNVNQPKLDRLFKCSLICRDATLQS